LRRQQPRKKAWLLPLAAKTDDALVASAAAMATYLRASDAELSDIAHTASVRRTHFEHRLAVAAGSKEEMASALDAFARGEPPAGVLAGRTKGEAPRVVFVFPGHGSQWVGMGRALLEEEPAFRQALWACDAAIRREGGFSVLEELGADEARSRLGEVDVVQPVLFAVGVALAALWRSWGVEPAVVVGHSMGEVAAAYVAGALSLEDAAAVICRRSRLLRKVSGKGAMALVELALEDADAALEGHRDRLSVALSNGPRSTVIAGDPAALEEVLASLEARNVLGRRVKTDVAFHSPQVDPLRDDLVAALREITPRAASIPMRSTVTGGTLAGTELAAAYWGDNLREPVRFSGVVQGLLREGNTLFLELSPHPILLHSIEENLRDSSKRGAVAASLRRGQDERASLLASLGRLYVEGHPVDFCKLHPHGGRVVSLPSYPWQRQRYWVDAGPASGVPRRLSSTSRGHGLLGEPFTIPALPTTLFYEGVLGADRPFPLAERRLHGRVTVPWGLGLQCLVEATRRKHEGDLAIEDVTFCEEPTIDESNSLKVHLSLSGEAEGMTFALASLPIDAAGEERGAWGEHARGRLRREDGAATAAAERGSEDRAAIQARSDDLSREAFYLQMAQRGLSYGAGLRVVQRAWVRPGEALGRLVLPEETRGAPGGDDRVWSLLEGCLQLIHAALPARSSYRVRELRRAHLGRVVPCELFGLARVVQGAEGAMVATVSVVDDEGRTVFAVADMLLAPVAKQPVEDLDDAGTVERIVRSIFRQVTGRKDDDIADTRELDEVGVDSLMTVQMLRRTEQAFGVEMSMRALARAAGAQNRVTIRWIVDRVLSLRRLVGAAATPASEGAGITFQVERVERHPESSAIHGGVLAADIPIEASTIILSCGLRVEVMSVGSGTPLVLLCPIMASLPIWVYQIQHFWRDYRIITLNWPGYGRSTGNATALEPSALARLVVAVLDELGVHEAAHIVGWSMGGMVAQELGLSCPERVRSIGLINTTSHLEEVDTLANFEDILGRLREDLMHGTPGLDPSRLEQRDKALEACQREAGTNRSLGYLAEVLRFDARDRIRGIRAPTLVVQGREDKLAVPRYGHLMSREIPGATYHEFEEGSHFVPLHLPDAFNRVLATFLSRKY
jgi:acyl transferase domain-containing protein